MARPKPIVAESERRPRGRPPAAPGETKSARLAARITPALRAAIDARGGDAWAVEVLEAAVKASPSVNPSTGY